MINVMDTYEKIKKFGFKAKVEADTFIQSLSKKYTKENPAPPEVINQGLEGILKKYEPVISNDILWPYAAGLTAIALILGLPTYIP